MKLAEIYANICGVKLPKTPVEPYKTYFPTEHKYITLHSGGNTPSKIYDYFDEVINELAKRLKGFSFVQIGDKSDRLLSGCVDLRGKADSYQTNYLISNAALHVGNDSEWVHSAGSFGIPVVALYGPTVANSSAPFFSHEKSQFLEPERKGRPSYSAQENPKTINAIKPERVINGVLKILGKRECQMETIHIGKNYKNVIIETLADATLPNLFKDSVINVRLDLGGDESYIPAIIQGRKFSLVVNSKINLANIIPFKSQMMTLFYKTGEDCDCEFVSELVNSGLPARVVTEDESALPELKFKLLNLTVPNLIVLPEKPDGDMSKCMFKSSRILHSRGKFYLSEHHLDATLPMTSVSENLSILPETDDSLFWKGADNYFIFKP